jgi:hypothetical protein
MKKFSMLTLLLLVGLLSTLVLSADFAASAVAANRPDSAPLASANATAPAWAAGVAYNVGDLVTYQGSTYQCLQAHTSEVGWEPATTPALWQLVTAGTTTPAPTTTAVATTTPPVTTTAPVGATNIALNKTATASSNENSSTLVSSASNAVDGNTGTRWGSAFSDPQWLQVDLGATYNVTQVVLNWEAAYGKAYQIQVSNDAANWTSIYSTSNGAGGVETLNVSGSGRYIRMYGTARATAYGYSLWEFQVFGTVVSTTNIALNKTATSSSNETTAFTPSLAVDGNTGTRWSSAFSDPQWLQIDLGANYNINQVILNWEAAYGKAYQIQVSNDAANWATIYSTSNGAGGVETLNVSGSGRYIRMYGTARGTAYGYSLWEFQVFGTPGGTITTPPPTTTVPPTTTPPVTGGLPAHVFAPYTYSWGSMPSKMAQLAQSQGIKYFTLAFMLGNGCQAEWNGNTTLDQSGFDSYISNLRNAGGDVIVSFGGADGTYLEDTCSSASSMATQLQTVIDRYNLTYIDFDVENDFGNSAAQTRRAQAIAQVQAHARSLGKTLKVSFTLGVDTSGLPGGQIGVLNAAISNGVDVGLVNIMVMDYGGAISNMGNAAIQSANGTFNQLKSLFPSKSNAQIWAMIGITPMIGQNDSAGEIFGLSDAQQVLSFAQQNNIGLLAFWAIDRDFQCAQVPNGPSDTCSSVSQAAYGFSNIFKAITH